MQSVKYQSGRCHPMFTNIAAWFCFDSAKINIPLVLGFLHPLIHALSQIPSLPVKWLTSLTSWRRSGRGHEQAVSQYKSHRFLA